MADYIVELLDELNNRQFPVTLTDCIVDRRGESLNSILHNKNEIFHFKVATVDYFDVVKNDIENNPSFEEELLESILPLYTDEIIAFNNSNFKDGVFNEAELENKICLFESIQDPGVYFVSFGNAINNEELSAIPIGGNIGILNAVAGLIPEINQPVLTYISNVIPLDFVMTIEGVEDWEDLMWALLTLLLISVLFVMFNITVCVEDEVENTVELIGLPIGLRSVEQGDDLEDLSENLTLGFNFPTKDLRSGVDTGVISIFKDGSYKFFSKNINKYKDIHEASLLGALIPGNEYIISDYQTIVDDPDVKSDYAPLFALKVKAKDYWNLEEEALVIENANTRADIFTRPHIGIEKVKYSLENDKTKFPWVSEDSYIEIDIPVGNKVKFYKTNLKQKINNVLMHVWRAWQSNDKLLDRGVLTVYTQEEAPNIGDTCFGIDHDSLSIVNVVVNENPSKGFIYEMTDKYGNQAPWDFYNLKFKVYNKQGASSFNPFPNEVETAYYRPTFYCPHLQGYGSTTMVDLSNLAHCPNGIFKVNNTDISVKFVNNKITGKQYIPYDVENNKSKAVITSNLSYKEGTNIVCELKNTTVESCDVIAMLPNNSTIGKGCEGLYLGNTNGISSTDAISPILNVLPGTNLDVLADYDTINTNVLYIGKNSNGEVKMWNPVDLVQ